MNYQQLEYIVAVDTYRHFVTASEKCFVTQPTLSMMIKRLEDELDTIIFDRSKQPVVPTEAGKQIIDQARIALAEMKKIPIICNEYKGILSGTLQIGIIPTIAPYLIPLFLTEFRKKFPDITLNFSEITTSEITNRLIKNQLDCAIVATPLFNNQLTEKPLYYEEFMLYASKGHSILKEDMVLTDMINYNELWLLQESHCMRNQIINFCDLKNRYAETLFNYEVGSIETLKKLADLNNGITILPELAVNELDEESRKRVRKFAAPHPNREISLITYRHFIKAKMMDALASSIIEKVPQKMLSAQNKAIAPVI